MPEKNLVFISDKAQVRVQKGSLWVFKSEIKSDLSSFSAGEIVAVESAKGFAGKGYLHPSRTLAVRILTKKKEPITSDFFRTKLLDAAALRDRLGFSSDAPRRIVNGEGDALPGLIVDQYGSILVVNFLTIGMEKWKTLLLDLLKNLFQPEVILEKSTGDHRKQEGLEPVSKLHFGNISNPVLFKIDGIQFYVDFLEGHKTGFYLDQRENRLRLKDYVKGATVLDPFAYTGGMSLYAASFGASRVDAVEDSRKIFPLLEKNILENRMEGRVHPACFNAFYFLRDRVREKRRYDVVILDPPSFAKSRKEIKGALRGYKDLHLSAFRLLNPGGFLITYSCSQNIQSESFMEVILEAAADCRRSLQLLEKQGAGRDHPVRAGMPETEYLKGFVFRVG